MYLDARGSATTGQVDQFVVAFLRHQEQSVVVLHVLIGLKEMSENTKVDSYKIFRHKEIYTPNFNSH